MSDPYSGPAGYGTKRKATVSGGNVTGWTASDDVIDMRDYSAWDSTGNNDSSSAFDQAGKDSIAAKGVDIFVPPRSISTIDGECVWAGPNVAALDPSLGSDYTPCGYGFVVRGGGTSSQIRLADSTGNKKLFQASNLSRVKFENLLLRGNPASNPAPWSADRVFDFNGIDRVVFENVILAGALCRTAYVKGNSLGIAFLNCIIAGGGGAAPMSIIDVNGWRSFLVSACQFVNYFNWDGGYYYQNGGTPLAWVNLGRDESENMDAIAMFQGSHFDDGPLRAIHVEPREAPGTVGNPKVSGVIIDGCTAYKPTLLEGDFGRFINVNSVDIRVGTAPLYGDVGKNVYSFFGVDNVQVSRFKGREFSVGQGRFLLDAYCGSAKFIDCAPLKSGIQSDADSTMVEENGVTRHLRVATTDVESETLVKWAEGTPWAPSTYFNWSVEISHAGGRYRCYEGGMSSSDPAAGPTGKGAIIVDGTGNLKWTYIGALPMVAQLGTSDSAALAVGVAKDGTARATGWVKPKSFTDTVEGWLTRLIDGFGSTLVEIWWTKNGTNYDNASNPIRRTAYSTSGMTAAQNAAVYADVVSAFISSSQLGFDAPTVDGDQVNLVNSRFGQQGDQEIQNGTYVFGTYGMTGGRSHVLVCEDFGQSIWLKSDGASALAAGDPYTASTTTAGRIKKAVIGDRVLGIVQGSVPAVAGSRTPCSWAPSGAL